MDKEILISNIQTCCERLGIRPTVACQNAGVGKSFISHIRDGQTPSVAKVADLAAYLGVSVSDLVGDTKAPTALAPLSEIWDSLNKEGRERFVQYGEDLVASGRYIKSDPSGMGEKEA